MSTSSASDLSAIRPGTLTRIVRQKRNPDRVSLFIDGEFAFGLAAELVLEAGLQKGKNFPVEVQRDLLVKQRSVSAREKALRLLALRPQTTEEIRRKLRRKDIADDVIEEAVAALKRLNYLDDAAYARQFVQERFEAKGHGPARLRSDLIKRGVPRRDIDQALESLRADEIRRAARKHGEARWRALAGENDPRRRLKKTMDYLARRGFSYGLIRDVTDGLAEKDDDTHWTD